MRFTARRPSFPEGQGAGNFRSSFIAGTLSLRQAARVFPLQRYKGLGEMNAEQLWETTLDPNVRSLLQVKVNDANGCG